ncbi:AEC family transporter [Opitutus terrae]|uniref:Auxin Efflux Carrier n=1 Tax=Opitutus terrae (strain DSM 11246 / JCM 15787 / PB90-1) TaxID=452637 RepID=B1ZSU4_OPITP|nr:AEC family transporter [Opitutus terrae]ACB74788.1 Auxin Efflux Carrier [Opitutus terrae PB90-1]
MLSYWDLLLLILPVFAIVAIGVVLRRVHWVEGAAEASMIRIVISLCMPCLIFESVVGNPAMREAGNVVLPPLVGFGTTVVSIVAGYHFGRLIGLTVGNGLRTFALSAGLANYGYLPLPIMGSMFGADSRGVLLIHNMGVEAALWTVGVLVLSGASWREGGKRLLSPIVLALFVSVTVNLLGWGGHLPAWFIEIVHSLAVVAIPLGLVMTGVNLANHLGEPRALFEPRVSLGAMVLRLGLLPLFFLALARWLPCSLELKRVIVVQGAMPSAVIPIIIAQHYGGRPLTAVQIVLGTTALAIVLTPLWLSAGLAWVGV